MAVSDDVEQALAAVNPAPAVQSIDSNALSSLMKIATALDILGVILLEPEDNVESGLLSRSLYWSTTQDGPYKITVTDTQISTWSPTNTVVITYTGTPTIQTLKPIFRNYFPALYKI